MMKIIIIVIIIIIIIIIRTDSPSDVVTLCRLEDGLFRSLSFYNDYEEDCYLTAYTGTNLPVCAIITS